LEDIVFEVGFFLSQVIVDRKLSAQQDYDEPHHVRGRFFVEQQLETGSFVLHLQQSLHLQGHSLNTILLFSQVELSHLFYQPHSQFNLRVSSTPHCLVTNLRGLLLELERQGLAEEQVHKPKIKARFHFFHARSIILQITQHFCQRFCVSGQNKRMIGIHQSSDLDVDGLNELALQKHRVVIHNRQQQMRHSRKGVHLIIFELQYLFHCILQLVLLKN
jgi:hypothetical protein